MCSFFWKRMENDQGDLADIVRASGSGGASSNNFLIADWQFPSEPVSFLPSMDRLVANLQDPLLHELAAMPFFGGPDSTAGMVKMSLEGGDNRGDGLFDQKELGEEMKRPCDIFSRVLQISPDVAKSSSLSQRVIRPSPIVANDMVKANSTFAGCAVDHSGVQISSPRTPGIKRRKSQPKKVVCIPAPATANNRSSGEVVPSDLWAWRKYGQKPIKGSPYPRGYYRCSSSKGCSARKQVERSRTDPNMLVITYTSEHNHPWPTQRNALAGSTRSQPGKNNSSASKDSPRNQRLLTSLKEEPKETMTSASTPLIKEEVGEMEKVIDAANIREFDQVFHQSYKSMLSGSNQADDFFADLGELEPDPMNIMYSRELLGDKLDEERETKALDPLDIFDWGGSPFGEAKRGL